MIILQPHIMRITHDPQARAALPATKEKLGLSRKKSILLPPYAGSIHDEDNG